MATVALLGGSFDPVHIGHLVAAEAAADALACDDVRLIPVNEQPWKPEGPAASGAHRLAMLQAAVQANPRLWVDDVELRRPGPSFTVDTLRALARTLDQRPYLLVGSDVAAGLPQWHESTALRDLAEIVIFGRADQALPTLPYEVRAITVPNVEVSATSIREKVCTGASIRYLVPEPVRDYIMKHRLYR